jgi:hypothetical protein
MEIYNRMKTKNVMWAIVILIIGGVVSYACAETASAKKKAFPTNGSSFAPTVDEFSYDGCEYLYVSYGLQAAAATVVHKGNCKNH